MNYPYRSENDIARLEERNKAFSATIALNSIILQTLDFNKVSQLIADAIPKFFGYQTGVLAVVNEETHELQRIAISQTTGGSAALESLEIPFESIAISLDENENYCIKALKENKVLITHDLYDVLRPVVSKENSRIVQNKMGTKTTLIYPIYSLENRPLGTFLVSMNKPEDQIYEFEKETISSFVDNVRIALVNSQYYSSLKNTTEQLQSITSQLYKKNLELAERNKTLSLLRQIDLIVLSTVTDTQQIGQKVVDLVVSETDVKRVIIYLQSDGALVPLAVSRADYDAKLKGITSQPLYSNPIPLNLSENIVALTVATRTAHLTHNLHDILHPFQTDEEARKIQSVAGIVTSFVYPLIVRNETIGGLVINSDKSPEQFLQYQKDLIDRLVGVIGIALDNALLYQKIQDANEKLKQLDKLKDEFVSLASHELRTPMTIIKSYTWMLLQGKVGGIDEKQKEYLGRVYSSTERLINLVNDMLNISRIESGRIKIAPVATDMVKLLGDIVTDLNTRAQELGIHLLYQPSANIPIIQADAERIKQVVINLIGNSFKFTLKDGTITVKLFEKDECLVTQISDNGKGISAEDIPKLFQKFNMVGQNYMTKQNSQGTGLGLYLSKQLIELHGGKIWAESPGEGKGSTFSFALPIKQTIEPE